MMIHRRQLLAYGILWTAPLATLAAAVQQSQPNTSQAAVAQANPKHPAATPPQQAQQSQTDGERIFAQNCSRCHTAPDGFSPRISGTIVRHMRVRASLSQHDEQELLRFFNP